LLNFKTSEKYLYVLKIFLEKKKKIGRYVIENGRGVNNSFQF